MVANVEPAVPPAGQIAWKLVLDILFIHLALKPTPSDLMWGLGIGMRFEMKKMAELPVRFDPKKGFALLHKDGNMHNGVGIELMDLDVVIIQQSLEKI